MEGHPGDYYGDPRGECYGRSPWRLLWGVTMEILVEIAMVAAVPGPGTRSRDPGPGPGPGTRDPGPGPGTRDLGPGTRARDPGPGHMGPGPKWALGPGIFPLAFPRKYALVLMPE